MNLDDPAERSAVAGEYVLGTLEADVRAAVDAALVDDARLRAEVGFWQDRLLGLAARAAPAEPSPGLWPRILSGLASIAAPASAAAPAAAATPEARPAPVVPGGANDPDRRTRPAARAAWWQGLAFWRGLAGAAVAGLVLAVALLLAGPEPAAASYLALLQAPDGGATGWVVEGRSGQALKLVPIGAGAAVPAGRSLQFWTKPEGAAGPTSLGLVRAGEALAVPASRLPGLGERQLFEITLEPAGGSTIGRPTGPILFIGRTIRL